MRNEAGFSLVEVLVASMVMSLIMAGLYASFSQSQLFYENYQDASSMLQQARNGMDRAASEIRSAGYDIGSLEPLAVASDTSLQFVADIDDGDAAEPCGAAFESAAGGGAERVTYTLNAETGDLVRSVDCYNGSAWTSGVQVATIAQQLNPTAPVFRYYDADGNQLPSSSGGTLSASERDDVASVEILFELLDAGETQLVGEAHTNLSMSTRVRLHNITG